MGGDEFAILQMAISQPSDATALALRIIDAIGAPYQIDGHQVVIGTSVGIAIGPTDGTSPEELLRNADLALYRAKADGRGTFRFFEHGMDLQMQERRTLEADLRRAVQAGEFELHYQPVVNLESGDVRGFEALMRWRHPDKGMVPPATFIALAEEIGCIIPLGEWAIRQACATAAAWPEPLEVAVNLSPVQFSTPGLVQVVMSALAASGLPARRLELEITESTLLQDSESTLATLFNLRALGVRIAMDDFGTGYSSPQLPAELPVRQDQDRPLLHQGRRRRRRLAQHRARRRRHGQGPRHDDHGRGRRDPGAARCRALGGLHGDAGLPVRQAAAGRRDRGALPGAPTHRQRLLLAGRRLSAAARKRRSASPARV